MNDVGFVCAYFNPLENQARYENYFEFAERIQKKATLVTVELSIGDSAFQLPETDLTIRLHSDSFLWHKERLLQIGAERLRQLKFAKIGWLDSDIVFLNDDWMEQISQALDTSNFIQCFRSAAMSFDDQSFTVPGAVSSLLEEQSVVLPASGGAWAARGDFFDQVGLFDKCVVGGFDMLLVGAFFGGLHGSFHGYGAPFREQAGKWIQQVQSYVKLGVADNKLVFLPHGTLASRRYGKRHALMDGFDPEQHVAYNRDGVLEWSPEADYSAGVRQYFCEREQSA